MLGEYFCCWHPYLAIRYIEGIVGITKHDQRKALILSQHPDDSVHTWPYSHTNGPHGMPVLSVFNYHMTITAGGDSRHPFSSWEIKIWSNFMKTQAWLLIPLSRQLSLKRTDDRRFRGSYPPGSPSPDGDSPPPPALASTCLTSFSPLL